jgi:hypothetical protein
LWKVKGRWILLETKGSDGRPINTIRWLHHSY